MKARLWIDQCNFATCVREQMGASVRLDYERLGEAAAALASTFDASLRGLQCIQTRVFSSRPPVGAEMGSVERNHFDWLVGLQDRTGSDIVVHVFPRVPKAEHRACPVCQHIWTHTRQRERAVDMALAMDLVRLTVEGDEHGKAEAVILASQDYDYSPTVQLLQHWGIPVINLGFKDGGHNLANVCDALVTVQELGERVIHHRKGA